NILPEVKEATAVMAGRRERSAIHDEFFAQARSANLGGTLDIAEKDLRDTKALDAAISRGKEEGRSVGWLLVAKAIAKRNEVGYKKIRPLKWLNSMAQGRRALV